MRRLCLLALCMILLVGCAAEPPKAQRTVFAMDTVMDLQVWGADGEEALDQLQSLMAQLEDTWSVTRQDSVLSQLHQDPNTPLTDDQAALLAQVAAMEKRTGGLFDHGLYGVTDAWGFYDKHYRIPTDEEIREGIAENRLDLGGALKGYCGDRAVALLQALEVDCALLSLGGNIQTYGTKPDGSAWQLGIQDPDGGEPAAVLSVTGTMAVVTSGDYQRYFAQDGKRYHHIIDPRTGYPADSGLRSVTVLCKNGLTADCLSTALFVMGLEDGAAFWRQSDDFEAVFMTADGRIYATEGAAVSGCEYEVIER